MKLKNYNNYWIEVDLKDYIFTIESGKRPKGGAISEGVPSLGGEHIDSNGGFNIKCDKLKYVPREFYEKMKNGIIKSGDVLIVKDGATTGKVAYVNDEFPLKEACINEHLFLLRTKTELNSRYLSYYLRSSLGQNKIMNDFRGATVGGISKKFVDFKMMLPTVEIQLKIVEVLEKVESTIEKRKKSIILLDELVKSKFIEMFGNPIINSKGWDIKLLGEVCEMKAGKSIKSAYIYENNNGKLYPCYGGNGLRGYVKDYSHDGNIPLIGRQGALCGNVKYVQGKFYATEHAVVTNPKIKMNTYWLYYILQQLDLNRLSTGAAQPGLTISKLNDVELPIAPIGMQKDFENFAKQVDKLKFEMEKSLKELEDNFNSLMQKAFKGELFK